MTEVLKIFLDKCSFKIAPVVLFAFQFQLLYFPQSPNKVHVNILSFWLYFSIRRPVSVWYIAWIISVGFMSGKKMNKHKALCIVVFFTDTWFSFWYNCLALSQPWVEKKTHNKKQTRLECLNTLWMTEHIPCELPFPRSREWEYPCKPPGGGRAPSPAVNIYSRGAGVGWDNSLIARYEKFDDCAILVWSFFNLVHCSGILSLYSPMHI